MRQADRMEQRVLPSTRHSFLFLCNTQRHTHTHTHTLFLSPSCMCMHMCITFLVPGILGCNHRCPDDRVYGPPWSRSTTYFPVHFFQETQSQTISHPVLKIKSQTIKNQPTLLYRSVTHFHLHIWFWALGTLSYRNRYRWKRLGFQSNSRSLFNQ